MTDGPGWTDDRVERLKALWAEGWSCGQMAAKLGGGLTRNAVIGKCARLGLAGRAAPSPAMRLSTAPKSERVRPPPSKPREPRSARPAGNTVPRVSNRTVGIVRARAAALAPPKPVDHSVSHADREAAIEAIAVAPRPWESRQSGECAAPIGSGEGLLSCCNPTDGTWCPAHHALFHTSEKPRPIRWDVDRNIVRRAA